MSDLFNYYDEENTQNKVVEQVTTRSVNVDCFISSHFMPTGADVLFNDNIIKVKSSRLVKMTYNPRKNILVIYSNYEYILSKNKQDQFVKKLGYASVQEFIKDTFKECTYVFNMASCDIWFNELSEDLFSFK